MKEKKKIVHCQSSIFNCFGLVLVSVKRRNEVERPERRCLSEASLRRAEVERPERRCLSEASLRRAQRNVVTE